METQTQFCLMRGHLMRNKKGIISYRRHSRKFCLQRFIIPLLFFFTLCNKSVQCAPNPTAYETLGVSRNAAQDDIQRNYRKLCLKYHPDKNVGKSESERKKCEDTFKKIQEANTAIGDKESRAKYDNQLRNPFSNNLSRGSYGNAGSSPYSSAFAEAMYRSYEQQRRQQYSRRSPFYVNGIDVSSLFPDQGKSVFVAQVSVPLSDLYKGKSQHNFIIKDSIWNRYKAAFKGTAARQLAVQGLLSSFAILLKSGWSLSVCFFGVYFHCQLPQLRRTNFSTRLKPGWKSGTKLTFQNVEPGIDVIFVIKEENDGEYERVGNDLVKNMVVARSELEKNKQKTGGGKCRLHINLFDKKEGKIEITLSKDEVKSLESSRKTEVVVKGRGWPIKDGLNGDLKVRIKLSVRRKKKRKEKSKKLPSGNK